MANSIPQAISYLKPEFPSLFLEEFEKNPRGSKKLDKAIKLTIQGEAIEISENYPLPFLMKILELARQVSPEMVLNLNSGKRILIFSHWGSPVLRDDDIYKINFNPHFSEPSLSLKETIVDLNSLDKKIKAKNDFFTALEEILKEAEKTIKPNRIITFQGKAPAALVLLLQYYIHCHAEEIWYQENPQSAARKIK